MQKYEYTSCRLINGANHDKDLDDLGKQGWLVVALHVDGSAFHYVLTRPIDTGVLSL